jgi:hypothetical protein
MIVTFALASGLPDGSKTRPTTVPEVVCALTDRERTNEVPRRAMIINDASRFAGREEKLIIKGLLLMYLQWQPAELCPTCGGCIAYGVIASHRLNARTRKAAI